jgi:pentatricopeptide repeat protein
MVIDTDKIEVLESKRSYLSGDSMLLDDLTGIDGRKNKKISCGLGRLSIGKEVSDITQFEFLGDYKNTKSSCDLRTVRAKDGDSESNCRHWMKTVVISCNMRIISEVNPESKRKMSYLSGDHKLLDNNIDNDSKKNGGIPCDFLLPNTNDSVSGTEGSGHSEKLLLRDDRRGIGSKKNQKNSCDWKTVSTTEAILHMEQTTEFPSNDDFISILLKCMKEKDFLGLNRMFALISDSVESNRNRSLGNYFVPAFVDCGRIACAVHVFEKLQYRNEYSWTSLIQGYIDQGETQHAFDLYDRMKQELVHPNSFTLVALLTACVSEVEDDI